MMPLTLTDPARDLRQSRREAVLIHLLDHNGVEPKALERARTVAERAGQSVEMTLSQMGAISDEAIKQAYAAVGDCRVWDPAAMPPDPELIALKISSDYLREKRLLPLSRSGSRLVVAACDPLDDEALAGVCFATGLAVEVMAASPTEWRRAFNLAYGEPDQSAAVDERKIELDVQFVTDTGADGEAARLITSIFDQALARGASDIHFEPRRNDLRVRLRVDGRLLDVQFASTDLAAPVVSRIKVLADLDLGERRLPQDGRATFVVAGRPIDVRVSILPSAFGEAAVLRLLDRTAVGLDLVGLGFAEREAGLLNRVVHAPHGIFLVTGPTGSGKTTTLYALLNALAETEKKILSIEDPIEYHFQHVVQTQVAPGIGLTFASALRAFLRQDPDVILVGEIRDPETAQVAIQAAMTGHLVLASLHANSAVKVIPRLLDMGLEPYQLAATLLGAAAQRLVRRLCFNCRREREPTSGETSFMTNGGRSDIRQVFDAVGCEVCGGSGYRGRIALVEGLSFDDNLAAAVVEETSTDAIASIAEQTGYRPMLTDGLAKVEQGLTSLREVMASGGE